MNCPLHPEQPQPCAPCGIARVRAALRVAPKPAREADDKPDPTRDRALARARDRADREDQP